MANEWEEIGTKQESRKEGNAHTAVRLYQTARVFDKQSQFQRENTRVLGLKEAAAACPDKWNTRTRLVGKGKEEMPTQAIAHSSDYESVWKQKDAQKRGLSRAG